MRSLLLAVLATAAALTGCIGPGVTAPDAAAPREAWPTTAPVATAPARNVTTDCGTCWEPTIAADPEGRIFVSYGGPTLFAAPNASAAFEEVQLPPLPPGAPPTASRGDETVDVGPKGRLYFSALIAGTGRVHGDVGVQVARSDDGGETWAVNTLVSITESPPDPAFYMDRQWLGFGAGDTVYLSYWQWVPRSGVWLATSHDGGATFSTPTLVASTVDRGGRVGSPGPTVETPEGRVVLPYAARSGGGPEVRVALSDDGGQTFRHLVVATTGDTSPRQWPVATVGPDGALHVAWSTYAGGVFVATSRDGGETWGEAVEWSANADSAILSPWARARNGGLGLLWYSEDGDYWRLTYAHGRPDGAPGGLDHMRVTDEIPAGRQGGGLGGNHAGTTDFPHFALLPDGRAAVVWSTGESLRVAFAPPFGHSPTS